MTTHHIIALALAVALVFACIVFGQHCGDHIKDILYFAGMIATGVFAHAQGIAKGEKAKKKKLRTPEVGDGSK